jgi:amino acid transporter
MEFVYNLFLVLHFIGLAMLLGGWFVQMSSADKGVNRTMLEGALLQLITGLVLVGMLSAGAMEGEEPNNTVVGIKFLVLIVITVLALIGRRRQPPQVALWAIIGALTVVNIVVAVFAGVVKG